MTEQYRQTELARATEEWKKAYERYETAKTKKAKREASEDIQFWGNKKSFLGAIGPQS